MLTSGQVKETLAALSAEFPEAGVYLYGSYSRGQQSDRSDLDVLLVFDQLSPEILTELEFARLSLQENLPVLLSLRPTTPKTFICSDTPFWRTILRGAKLFYQRS